MDRIPPKKFVGPACVIDVSAESKQNPDYLLTRKEVGKWEEQHGKIPAGAWVSVADRLVEAKGSQGLHQPEGEWAAHSWIS